MDEPIIIKNHAKGVGIAIPVFMAIFSFFILVFIPGDFSLKVIFMVPMVILCIITALIMVNFKLLLYRDRIAIGSKNYYLRDIRSVDIQTKRITRYQNHSHTTYIKAIIFFGENGELFYVDTLTVDKDMKTLFTYLQKYGQHIIL